MQCKGKTIQHKEHSYATFRIHQLAAQGSGETQASPSPSGFLLLLMYLLYSPYKTKQNRF